MSGGRAAPARPAPAPGRRAGSAEIVPLTSLRGIAAMAVVMQHFSATAQLHSAVTIPSLVPHGYLAVDLFFTLSGFIMSYTYLQDFQDHGLRAFGPFLGKRIARIVPLNTAVLLLVLAAGLASARLTGRNIVYAAPDLPLDLPANLLLLQGLGIGTNLNGPSWSISTEFAAYCAFPALIRLVFARRGRVWAPALLLCAAALAGIAATEPRLGSGWRRCRSACCAASPSSPWGWAATASRSTRPRHGGSRPIASPSG